MNIRKKILTTAIPVLLGLSLSTPAYAYLDPGTGSIILQGIIAGIAMVSLTLKMYWQKFIGLFRKNDTVTADADEEGDETGKDKSDTE